MIVTTEQLSTLKGPLAMVDGGFDPLHAGHLKYFEEARRLGVPVLCNVQDDRNLVLEKSRPPLLVEEQRAKLLDSLRTIDYVHVCQSSTADVIKRLGPKYYVKGSDWKTKVLPADEREACAKSCTEIVFLDTMLDSSSSISKRYRSAAHEAAPVLEGMKRRPDLEEKLNPSQDGHILVYEKAAT